MTVVIAKTINIIPGLHLRADGEAEALGMDEDQVRLFHITQDWLATNEYDNVQIGEFATDYIEVRRDYTDWTARPDLEDSPHMDVPADARRDGHQPPLPHSHSQHVAAGVRHGKPEVGSKETVDESGNEKREGNGHGLVKKL